MFCPTGGSRLLLRGVLQVLLSFRRQLGFEHICYQLYTYVLCNIYVNFKILAGNIYDTLNIYVYLGEHICCLPYNIYFITNIYVCLPYNIYVITNITVCLFIGTVFDNYFQNIYIYMGGRTSVNNKKDSAFEMGIIFCFQPRSFVKRNNK